MMTLTDEVMRAVSKALEIYGEQVVLRALLPLSDVTLKPIEELTIIGNAGMHTIPEPFFHGESYSVSEGSLDLSSPHAIRQAYTSVLRPLANKLRERPWKRIYLIPTGPTTLILQIKLLVYHITRLSTVDLHYSRGEYTEVELDYRDYLDLPIKEGLVPIRE